MKSLSLEGCSPLTTMGLESVVLAHKELEALRVVHCSNIQDFDLSEALALQIYSLKQLIWRPDVKRFLKSTLSGMDVGQHGGSFFKKWGGVNL
jgi:F-box/leucine-rich repeat protein 2/20